MGIQQAIQRLNDKIKNMLTLASALVPTVAGLGYFIAKETSSFWILFFTFFSVLAFITTIAMGIMLFTRSSSYLYVDPKVVIDNNRNRHKSLRFFVNRWASTYCDVANNNANVANAKLRMISYMNYCIIAGLAILVLSFLLLALSMYVPITAPQA